MTQIVWAGKAIETRHCALFPHFIRTGDFVLFKGELHKVITVQRDCPHLENLSKTFTAFTLVNRDGAVVPAHNLIGKRDVFKPRRKVWK